MATDRDLEKDFDTKYQYSWEATGSFYTQVEENVRFYLGDQWSDEEKASLREQGREAYVVNQLHSNIAMITGYQRKHRLSSVAVPLEPPAQQVSDDITELLLYFSTADNVYDTISACFEGTLYSAINMACPYVDYSTDPQGTLKVAREPYNGFVLDPFFSKRDLSDCGYLQRRKYLDQNAADLLLPKHKKDISHFITQEGYRDDKFIWLPYQRVSSSQPMIAVDEMWEQKNEKTKIILDTQTGMQYPFENEEQMYMAEDRYSVEERLVPYVERHIYINGKHVETQKNPHGVRTYPFVPFFCLWYPEQPFWPLKCQSLVNLGMDAQREANQRRSQIQDFIKSRITTGYIATVNSIVNPDVLFQTGQGRVVWKKKNTEDLIPITLPEIPQGLFAMKDMADNDLKISLNVSEELMGQETSEVDSGYKVALRQSAALVGLQPLMDELRMSQKLLAEKMVAFLPAIDPNKLARILGRQPAQELFDQDNLKCGIQIEEGLLTTTQKEMFFQQIVALQQLGVPTPPEVLRKAAPIQGKTEYNKLMDEFAQQQAQEAQKQQQVQDSLLDSEQKLSQAQAMSDIAKSKEYITEAEKNKTQELGIIAKAQDDRADAVLRRLESLKKLEELDEGRITRLLDVLDRLEMATKAESQVEQATAKQEVEGQQQEQATPPQQEQPPQQGAPLPQEGERL